MDDSLELLSLQKAVQELLVLGSQQHWDFSDNEYVQTVLIPQLSVLADIEP